MSENKSSSNGLGIGTILFLIFLTLKLAEIGPVQYWSWWWITSPLWIPLSFVIIILFILGLKTYIDKR
jgi:membrane protein YdbS with pleckstrin-like domain